MLLFVEGITILEIHGLITLHVFVGFILVGPVLLKCATTIYRFARYYSRDPAYVRRGTPPPFLRVLGPLVIISSVPVIGTGAGLLAVRPGQADVLLFAHKASFVVWFGVMALHVIGHLREAASESVQDLRARRGDPAGLSAGCAGCHRRRVACGRRAGRRTHTERFQLVQPPRPGDRPGPLSRTTETVR